MTKSEAIQQLNYGYIFFLGGLALGVLINKEINLAPLISGILVAYWLWSLYWGYRIMYKRFEQIFNAPIHIRATGTFDYFTKSIFFKWTAEFFKFWICYIVGALGGAIYKQVQLSRIAYI